MGCLSQVLFEFPKGKTLNLPFCCGHKTFKLWAMGLDPQSCCHLGHSVVGRGALFHPTAATSRGCQKKSEMPRAAAEGPGDGGISLRDCFKIKGHAVVSGVKPQD